MNLKAIRALRVSWPALMAVVMISLMVPQRLFAASCPYCGRGYGTAAPGDEARVNALRAAHESTCLSRIPPPPQDPRKKKLIRQIQDLVDQLNHTEDSSRRELELLNKTKQKMQELLTNYPGVPNLKKMIREIDDGITRWHQQANQRQQRQDRTDRIKQGNRIRSQLALDVSNAKKKAMQQQVKNLLPSPIVSQPVKYRRAVGMVSAAGGHAWAAMSWQPYIDASVVDLRDATTLTVDPAKVRGLVDRTPREKDALLQKMMEDLLALPPEDHLTLFMPWDMEPPPPEIVRLKRDLMTLPPEDQLAVLFPADEDRLAAAEQRLRERNANIPDDIPDLEVLPDIDIGFYVEAEDMDEAFEELFRKAIQEEFDHENLDDAFKQLFRKELFREWDNLGKNPKSAAIPRMIGTGSKLYPHDRVMLGSTGHLRWVLKDGTEFEVFGSSDVTLDAVEYDSQTQIGKVEVTLREGALRFATGASAQKHAGSMVLNVPTGQLTPHGTEVFVEVAKNQSTTISVLQGKVDFASHDKQYSPVTILQGQTAEFDSKGQIATLGETESDAPFLIFLKKMLAPTGQSWWVDLIKYTLIALGLLALFGWLWDARLRTSASMFVGGVLGVALLVGVWWLSCFLV